MDDQIKMTYLVLPELQLFLHLVDALCLLKVHCEQVDLVNLVFGHFEYFD